jgi:hypothetical protein
VLLVFLVMTAVVDDIMLLVLLVMTALVDDSVVGVAGDDGFSG